MPRQRAKARTVGDDEQQVRLLGRRRYDEKSTEEQPK